MQLKSCCVPFAAKKTGNGSGVRIKMSDFRLQPYLKVGDLLNSRPYVCFSHFSKIDHIMGARNRIQSVKIGAQILPFEFPLVTIISKNRELIVELPDSNDESNLEILEEVSPVKRKYRRRESRERTQRTSTTFSEEEYEEIEANDKDGPQFFIIQREQLLLLF
uniref:Uncharacterized protein n=1 Tax=Ditylenchus dipsaci TaxID=166011 RepID=A0A915EDI2_9BILA